MLKNQTTKLFLLGVLTLTITMGTIVAVGNLTVGKTSSNGEQVQCDTTQCDSTKCDTVMCDKPVGKQGIEYGYRDIGI